MVCRLCIITCKPDFEEVVNMNAEKQQQREVEVAEASGNSGDGIGDELSVVRSGI